MMDKSCHSSGEPAASATDTKTNTSISSSSNSISNSTTKDLQCLKQLNKFSHKISKPPIRKPTFDHHRPPPPVLEEKPSQPPNLQQQQQNQHQPPVYNINKSDFRDVVQKLTGSPAHDRLAPPPPIHTHPKPQNSRLQRIRPPPLENLTNRPPPLLNDAVVLTQNPNTHFFGGQRPLSPLPPFPAVHAAAESPISAYMRYFQAQPPATSISVPPVSFPMPTSPLPFGCLPSPKSPYPSSLLFSPTIQFGFQQFPLSPTLPVPSPRWKDI